MEKQENLEVIEYSDEIEVRRVFEKRLMEIFEQASQGMVVIDKFGRFVFANRKCEEISGYKQDEFSGKPVIEVIPKKYRSRFMKLFLAVMEGEKVEGEIGILNKQGKTVPIEFSSIPIRKNGEIIGVFSIIQDISKRKKLENKLKSYSLLLRDLLRQRMKELEEIKKRYSILVEQAGDGVVVIKKNGEISFLNNKLAEMLGYNKNEVLGEHFSKFIAPEHLKISSERFKKRFKGGKSPQTYEVKLLAKNGEKIPVEINATLATYEGETVDLIVLRDIRERKALEEQILKTQKLEAINQLATMVAHDLRNPLAAIRNAAYYVKRRLLGKVDRAIEEMLEIIEDEVVFANNIVSDLLDLAHEKPLELKLESINRLINDTLYLLQIPENIEVVKEFGNLPKIPVDTARLRRVFKNLIENAFQAMPKGGKLFIKTFKEGNSAKIIFRDTGVGISKENLKKIFTPFFTTKAKGIGVGLTICKKFVKDHGGKIKVKSEEGKGTTFTIILPIKNRKGGEKSE